MLFQPYIFNQIQTGVIVFPTWGSGASWPAWRWRRWTRRKVVDFVCKGIYMSCHAFMVFTCLKVLRLCNSVRGKGERVIYEPLEQTTCWWWGLEQIEPSGQCGPSTKRESVFPQDEAKMDLFTSAAVDSRWSMYECDTVNSWYCFWDYWMRKMWRIWMGVQLIYLFFCR